MRSSNGRKSGNNSFIMHEQMISNQNNQPSTISHLGNMQIPPIEIGSRINGRLSSQNLQQMSNLQENAYGGPPAKENNRGGIKLFPNPNSILNDGKFNARDQALILNSPYVQNQVKQQALLKRQSVGGGPSTIGAGNSEKRSNSTIVGSALIHTQADSGSSASLITKRAADGNSKLKKAGPEDDYMTDNDQDLLLHANISAGISIDGGGRRRQSQHHQFLTPNINGTRQSNQQNNQAYPNQQPILKPLIHKQIMTGGGFQRPNPQTDQLTTKTQGLLPLSTQSPSRKNYNSKTANEDTADQLSSLQRNESKINLSPYKKGRMTEIMPAKMGRQSDYNGKLKQIPNELRMNATPTPQLIETDLRKIFSNEIEMNVSRAAATQNHNETKTTTQARQPKVMQSDGNVKTSTNDYTAYNFKQVSLGRPLRYEGGDNTKRPDGPKTSIFRQSFEFNKNGATANNKMSNSPSLQVSLKTKLNHDDGLNFSEIGNNPDSGAFDLANGSPVNFGGFLPSYTNNRLLKQKLNNSDGDIPAELDNSPLRRGNAIKKPTGMTYPLERVDSALKSVQSQSDLLLPKVSTLGTTSDVSLVDSFAVKTRQGFIPSQAKPNQDSFISVKNLGGIEGLWMFGVCDGHGINGHMVSDFVKKNLPRILSAMFVQVISNGRKKHRKGASKVTTIAQKEDVVLPPLVKNQKAASSNFQSFHIDPSGEESSTTDQHEHLRRNNRSESVVPSMDEVHQLEEQREHFYQWFRNKADQRDTHIREAFRLTNERLDTATRIDCMMSGTTVVVTLLYRNMIICANAGDSRAVMFSLQQNEHPGLKAVPLSRDHKPEDQDEAARIRACNGRVEQSKIMPGVQLFGVNGKPVSSNLAGQHYGPKRVWLKNKQVPGLAMTRSLGDFVAKSVGVTSEPEIKVFSSIAENDRAMVIASDGIWDRIPNEEMAQVLLPFLDKKDPEGAAMELTRISVERWQKDHGMVDDITLVVVFLNTTQKLATQLTKQL